MKRICSIFQDIAYIWKMEFITIFKDMGVMIFLFLLPLGYPVLYGLIYNPETPHNIPIVVVDDSRSVLSRKFCRMLDATSQVEIVDWAADMQEAKALTAAQHAYGILSIDRNFQKNINRGDQSNISLFCNMSSLLYYRNILTASANVTATFNQQLQQQRLGAATMQEKELFIEPVISSSVALYNPLSGFASFIMPAVEVIVIQQSLLLAIGMLAGTERERNPRKELIPYNRHYWGAFRVICGKAMCFFTVSLLTAFWSIVVIPYIFSFPQIGHLEDLLIFILPFSLSSIFMSMTFSCIIRGRELPMLFFVFLSIPLLFLSGIIWPWSNLPLFWKGFGIFFPTTTAIRGLMQISSCGATIQDVSDCYYTQWCLTFFYFITSFFVYRHQIRLGQRSFLKKSSGFK